MPKAPIMYRLSRPPLPQPFLQSRRNPHYFFCKMGDGDLAAYVKGIGISTFGGICIEFISRIFHYHFFHPLAKFSGLFWGGVTRLWIAFKFWQGTELETEWWLHQRHGLARPCFDRRILDHL